MLFYHNISSSNDKSCVSNTSDRIKSFAKEKPLMFGLICFGILALIIIIIAVPIAISNKNSDSGPCSKNAYSDECLYEKMIAKQSEYPEGMHWNNDNCYDWKGGGGYGRGCGCAGFAFILSDVCFGDIKARQIQPCPNIYKVGDIVRINNDQHSVIILKIDSSMEQITIAEGNYGETIHWGRTFKFQSMNSVCNYILRRNPS